MPHVVIVTTSQNSPEQAQKDLNGQIRKMNAQVVQANTVVNHIVQPARPGYDKPMESLIYTITTVLEVT